MNRFKIKNKNKNKKAKHNTCEMSENMGQESCHKI